MQCSPSSKGPDLLALEESSGGRLEKQQGSLMTSRDTQLPVAYTALSEQRADEVAALRDRCNGVDGLLLKISIPRMAPETSIELRRPNAFLVYRGDALAGYCSLDGDRHTVEICGMVAPEHRRKGIGTSLLTAARDTCAASGVSEVLLICEDASAAGQLFVATQHARRQFAEHRMELADWGAMLQGLTHEPDLSLRRAVAGETGTLARISAAVFGTESELKDIQMDIEREFSSPEVRFYLGQLGGSTGPVVSSLKLYLIESRASIYAFGVLPEFRRRGLAWQTLALLTQQLQAETVNHIGLEVETTNMPAISLYRACGFAPVTTYGYYRCKL
jgi:ribosomal protein S18 acetylase RimI-like enzyme